MHTLARELKGEYRLPGRCHLAYHVQAGSLDSGVEVGHAGGVDRELAECLRQFQAGVKELVAQRSREGIELVGIDIVVEFLADCPASESCRFGYAFMYDVVEAETVEVR